MDEEHVKKILEKVKHPEIDTNLNKRKKIRIQRDIFTFFGLLKLWYNLLLLAFISK